MVTRLCDAREEDVSRDHATTPTPGAYSVSGVSGGNVVMLTAKATVLDSQGRPRRVNVLLDSGSEITFIKNTLTRELNLPIESRRKLRLATFGKAEPHEVDSELVTVTFRDKDDRLVSIQVESVPNLTKSVQSANLSEGDLDFIRAHSIQLSEQNTHGGPLEIDILLGIDTMYEFYMNSHEETYVLPSGLRLCPSSFGYLPFGKRQFELARANRRIFHSCFVGEMDSLWKLEAVGVTDDPKPKKQKELTLESYLETVEMQEGLPIFRFPWKEPRLTIPDNFNMAWRRLESVYQKYSKTPAIFSQYKTSIEDQLAQRIVEEVPFEERDTKEAHYLPHQAVITPNKSTTKLRVVFDGSAKMRGSPSLNDCLESGPVLLPSMVGLLIRFRAPSFVAVSDIEKAFLQIRLHECEKDFVRFLWLQNTEKPPNRDNLKILRFRRLPFGLNCSPFILAAGIIHHLQSKGIESIKGLEEQVYVDNILQGSENAEELVKECRLVKETFSDLQMNLREFRSNNSRVNAELEPLGLTKDANLKVLGVMWRTEEDQLVMSGLTETTSKLTKRSVVRAIARVFDPLGFLAPLLFPAKLFAQSLWKRKCDWDDPLDEEETKRWRTIEVAAFADSVQIPRRYAPIPVNQDADLIIFVDASQRGYAAVAYVRVPGQQGFHTSWRSHD